ncbi:hypothetical protein KAW64_05085, partial [bacterium]|nr:hypothetical protein [bacterium]
MKTSWYLIIVSAATVLLSVAVAGAEWSHDPSENNPVCEASGDQQSVQIVEDGVGGHIVSWEDSQTGDLNIYAQLVDAWGDVVWTSGGIVVTAANDQHIAKMVGDGIGGAIVVWQDYRNGTDYQIYAQRLDSSGAPMWGGGVAVCAEIGDQDGAVLVGDGSGGAIIAWADHRGAYGGAIYAQRVDASGTLLWPGGIAVAPDTVGARGSIAIAADGSGGAVLAWADDRAGDGGIYAARVDASGNEVWTSGGSIVVGAGTSWDSPAILGDGAGGATIVFE